MMGTLWKGLVLWLFVGDFVAAQYARRYRDAVLPPDLSRLFESFMPFSFEQSSGSKPYDSLFGSGRTPEMFVEFPPIMDVPRVEVFCDDSMLTVVVEKRLFARRLSREEMQLGDSCFSNAELPDKFVFSYGLDQCGTTQVMQDGRNTYTNSLHLNFKRTFANWLQTPPSIHISCMPVRSNFRNAAWTPAERSKRFNIQTMTSPWSHSAESNLYERGQVVNLQISAQIEPNQQLFVQSCFVSASPEPQRRPRHAVILNKGCASPVGSPHPIVQFVASDRTYVVNFVLNTSQIISEPYIHCSVLVSNVGVTYGSKSCNYNLFRSRWEELNGGEKVCDCCSSKCKGLPGKILPGAKAMVSTGPLVIVDKSSDQGPVHLIHEPKGKASEPIPNHTETEIPNPAGDILPGASVSRCKPSSGVVVVSQDKDSRQTLWLPGTGQGAEDCGDSPSEDVPPLQLQRRDNMLNDLPELWTPVTQEPHPHLITNELEGHAVIWDANLLTMVDGWPVSPDPNIAIIAQEFKSQGRIGDPVTANTEMVQNDNFLPTEVGVNILLVEDVPSPAPDGAVMKKSQRKKRVPDDEANDEMDFQKTRGGPGRSRVDERTSVEPMLRTKVEFSKRADGSKKLSYEEEMTRREDKGVFRGLKRDVMEGWEPHLKGIRSTFLSMLRSVDKEE